MTNYSQYETSICNQLKRACLAESLLFSELTESCLDLNVSSDESQCFQPLCAWTVGWCADYPRRVTGTGVRWRGFVRGHGTDVADTSTLMTRDSMSISPNVILPDQISTGVTSRLSNSQYSVANSMETLQSSCPGSGINRLTPVGNAACISTYPTHKPYVSSPDLLPGRSTQNPIDHRLFQSNTVLSYTNFKPRHQVSSVVNDGNRSCTGEDRYGCTSPALLTSDQSSWILSSSNVSNEPLLKSVYNHAPVSNKFQTQLSPPVVTVIGTRDNDNLDSCRLSVHVLQALTESLLMHISQQADLLLTSGCARLLYGLLATVELVIIELKHFDHNLQCYEAATALRHRVLCQLHAVHSEHIGKHLCVDPLSQDWSNERVHEEDTCSMSVRYWWVYVQGVFFDLRDNVSASMACEVLTQVLELTLGRLALNYCSIRLVSSDRQRLFFMDVVAILLAVFDVKRVVVSWTEDLLDTHTDRSLSTVYDQCQSFLLVLAYLLAPLRTIAEHIFSDDTYSAIDRNSVYMSFCFSRLYPSFVSAVKEADVEPDLSIFLYARCAITHFPSSRSWAPLVRALVDRGCYLAVLLLGDLSARQLQHSNRPNSQVKDQCVLSGESVACGWAACCGPSQCRAQLTVSHRTVCSALLLIVQRCSRSDHSLIQLLQPCVRLQRQHEQKLSQQLWTRSRRPVWLQALVDLVMPIVEGAVASLVDDILAAKADIASFDSERSMRSVFDYLSDLLIEIPTPLLTLFSLNDDTFSNQLHLGLGVHVLLCALYDTLNSESFVAEEYKSASCGSDEVFSSVLLNQVFDATVAVGEQLCSCYQQHQQQQQLSVCAQLQKSLAAAAPGAASARCGLPACTSFRTHWLLAVQLVARDDHGRRALWTVGAFLRQNINWLFRRLSVHTSSSLEASKASEGDQSCHLESKTVERGRSCDSDWKPTVSDAICADISDVLEQRVFWPQAAAVQVSVGPDCKLDGGSLLESWSPAWRQLLQLLPKPKEVAARRVWQSEVVQLLLARAEFGGTNTREGLTVEEINIVKMLSDKLKLPRIYHG